MLVVSGALRQVGHAETPHPLVTVLRQRSDAWAAVADCVCDPDTCDPDWLHCALPAIRHALLDDVANAAASLGMHAALVELARQNERVRDFVVAELIFLSGLYTCVAMVHQSAAALVRLCLDYGLYAHLQRLYDHVVAACCRLRDQGQCILPVLRVLSSVADTHAGMPSNKCARVATLAWLLLRAPGSEARVLIDLLARHDATLRHAMLVLPLLAHAHIPAAATLLAKRDAHAAHPQPHPRACQAGLLDPAFPEPVATALRACETQARQWLARLGEDLGLPHAAVFVIGALLTSGRAHDLAAQLLTARPSAAPYILPLVLYQLQRCARPWCVR